MTNSENCDAKTLAVIAAQFIALGDDEKEALRKANALYLKATVYAKRFASLKPDKKKLEAFPEEATRALGVREDLAIGDSEANSPALKFFRSTAIPKLDKNITHKKFVQVIEQQSGQKKPKKIAPSAILCLHSYLRAERSLARSARRQKSVK